MENTRNTRNTRNRILPIKEVHMTVRTDARTARAVEAIMIANDRSKSAVLRDLIRKGLETANL